MNFVPDSKLMCSDSRLFKHEIMNELIKQFNNYSCLLTNLDKAITISIIVFLHLKSIHD